MRNVYNLIQVDFFYRKLHFREMGINVGVSFYRKQCGGFIHFVDGFFSPVYNQLGINVFDAGIRF